MSLTAGTAHAVSGSGVLSVGSPGGLLVVCSGVPATLGTDDQNPPSLYGLGSIVPGSALGWSAGQRVLKSAEVFYPLLPDCTKVGYEFVAGVTATITELTDTNAAGGGSACVGVSALKLDYNLASDLTNVALVANAWTDIIADQNVVVGANTSTLWVTVNMALHLHATAAINFGTRLVFDSGASQRVLAMGGVSLGQALDLAIPGGSFDLGVVGAGTHRLKVQYFSNSVAGSYYIRGASLPTYEHLGIQAVEVS